MNISTPEVPQPGDRREGAVLRFLRWLIEPPVGPQPAQLRVLRWSLRAAAFVLYAAIAGPADGTGNGSAGRRGGKTGA
jgi:hypothetical protein